MTAVAHLRSVFRQVWLLLKLVGELVYLAPVLVVAVVVGVTAAAWGDQPGVAVGLIFLVVAVVVWGRVWPGSFERLVRDRLVGRRVVRRVRRSWPEWARACDLSRKVDGEVVVPVLRRVRWRQGTLTAEPVLLPGQSVDDVDRATERLRTAAKARRLRVQPNAMVTGCTLAFSFGDYLSVPFRVQVLGEDAVPEWRRVEMGRTEFDRPWLVDVARSTLVAGATGAGKASIMWAVMLGLGPAIRAGVVEVHGIDLKGGMELAMGKPLFTRYATDPERAVIVLEEAVVAMRLRAEELAGTTRQHTPTASRPLIIVVIDELAAVIAYLRDRDLRIRAEAALSVLLSQGRAVGYVVWGFVQDPRRDVVSMRNLFPRRIGLRLDTPEEVTMVLGDGAVDAGALCHLIQTTVPGTAYVIDEDGRPTKVRAPLITDDDLATAASRFASATEVPVIVPSTDEDTAQRRRRRSSERSAGRKSAVDAS